MFDKRPPSIETVRAVLRDGPVKLRFAESSKPWLLDAFTASAIVAVYDALSEPNRSKVDGMIRTKAGFARFVSFVWKHVHA